MIDNTKRIHELEAQLSELFKIEYDIGSDEWMEQFKISQELLAEISLLKGE